jgi:transcriptional regulator with GAF, ATPase, and Fis domain
VRLTEAERGFLVIVEGSELRIEAARNFDRESVRKPEDKISRSIAEQVARTGEDVLAADAQNDARFRESMSVSEMRLRSLVCVPLKLKKQVVGVLYLDNRFETGVFDEEDRSCLSAFADLAAIALENARLNETVEKRAADLAKEKERGEKLNTLLSRKLEEQGIEVSALADLAGDAAAPRYDYRFIIGRSPAIQETFRLLDRVVESEAPVLIVGESGTGKELVAKAIHVNGRRKDKPFVSENCAAIPETLLESELFGYKKGAFTGAFADKTGLFQQADGGTLFLDEIADMSPAMQKKLLRALQEGEVRRVGGSEAVKVNVRLIAASNKDLKRLMGEGLFREDLYYRINVLQVALPPLRDRREDVPALVEHFLASMARESGKPPKGVSKESMGLLMNYDWPGNVRELENEVKRAFTVSDAVIHPGDLSPAIQDAAGKRPPSATPPLRDLVREAVEKVERDAILSALKESGWKKSEAARILGVSRPTLDAKISSLNIQVRASDGEPPPSPKP